MIVAVSYQNGEVFQHYGETPSFMLYEIENDKVISTKVIESGEYSHHTLAILLANNNVRVVCCGRIGIPAVMTLVSQNIQVYDLCKGPTDKVIEDYLNGNLTFSGGHECHH